MAETSTKRTRGSRLRVWAEYLKIEHTLFSAPLVYAGALLAEPPLTPRTALLILVAAGGARTTALGLNRILDRNLDARNPRTAGRALPSGDLTLRAAVAGAAAAAAIYLAAAAAISVRCLLLAPIPLAVFWIYPLLKRWTRWAHLGVGAGLAMGPLGGYFAVSLDFRDPAPILYLALFTLLWSSGFDILYSVLDRDADRAQGLHSLPAASGVRSAYRVAAGLHAAAFAALAALYAAALSGAATLGFFLLAGALFVFQHRVRDDVPLAFFRVNAALGAAVFFGVVFSGPPPAG